MFFKRFFINTWLINLPPTTFLTNLIGKFLFYMNKICVHFHIKCPQISSMENRNDNAIFHCDWWQDKIFFSKDFILEFKPFFISDKNRLILDKISKTNSVAIHIRRGDYLKFNTIYSGICTQAYYTQAIEKIYEIVDAPFLFFFSDDPCWVKNHFSSSNMAVIDWNTGNASYIDMYLMSKCTYMVLANSTFSYCAARLNNSAKTIICPQRWNNHKPGPNLTLDNWIEI